MRMATVRHQDNIEGGQYVGMSKRPHDAAGQRSPTNRPARGRAAFGMVGIGLELAGVVGIMTLLGYGIDQWLDSHPWGLTIGALLGIVGGLYNLVKEAIKANR